MTFDPDALQRVIFQIEMPPFTAYLENLSEFLKDETKKHREDIDDLKEQIRLGKLVPDDKPNQAPLELQYEQYVNSMIGEIEEFENILLKSFFVTIYSFLEAHLTQHCRKMEQQNKLIRPSWSKWKKKNKGSTINKALLYLIKVQHLDPSLEHSVEWEKILCYVHLRNCIVHNEGRVDDDSKKELKECINQENSNLHYEYYVVLTKEFCKNVWRTIEEFLWLMLQAEIQAKA